MTITTFTLVYLDLTPIGIKPLTYYAPELTNVLLAPLGSRTYERTSSTPRPTPLYYVKSKQPFTSVDITTNNIFVRGLPSNIIDLA